LLSAKYGIHVRARAQELQPVSPVGFARGMMTKIKELTGIIILSAFCLGWAWHRDSDLFAMVFAMAGAIATVEVIQQLRS
jgi:hypothetical protein